LDREREKKKLNLDQSMACEEELLQPPQKLNLPRVKAQIFTLKCGRVSEFYSIILN